MPTGRRQRRVSTIALGACLVLVSVVFGAPATYIPGVYYALASVQLTATALVAWKLGVSAITTEAEGPRKLGVAGGMLVAPWALFSLLAGFGPPSEATHAENALRYLILLVSAIAVAGGLVVLREALSEAGERFYSTLGLAASLLAAPLYLVWAAMLLAAHRALALVGSGEVPPWVTSLVDLSDILLFFGGVLTYLATAAFAASLGRSHWLGRRGTRAFVVVSILAVLCVALRGLQFPDPTVAFRHWYTIPGFVVGIPAVPWIMPCLFGFVLLRRAGSEQS